MSIIDTETTRILSLDSEDKLISTEADFLDLISETLSECATCIAIPVSRLDEQFFDLRSGLAGAITQKAVNYRCTLAIIGEIDTYLAASIAFRDWVRECQRGKDLYFLPTLEDLLQLFNTQKA